MDPRDTDLGRAIVAMSGDMQWTEAWVCSGLVERSRSRMLTSERLLVRTARALRGVGDDDGGTFALATMSRLWRHEHAPATPRPAKAAPRGQLPLLEVA